MAKPVHNLTDPDFIRKLEMLSLLSRKVLAGGGRADRRTLKKGSGINFADYAEYSPGDDYRNIDWNIRARLGSLVIKLFEMEEDMRVYILFDLSHSMKSKLLFAKQLAAALSYITLNRMDRLFIYGLSDQLETLMRSAHGRARIMPMLHTLEQAETFGHGTDFKMCVKTFQARRPRPGLCIVISDFLTPGGWDEAFDQLTFNRHDVFCIQTINPAEMTFEQRGDIRLECIETGKLRDITVSSQEAKRFNEAMQNWNHALSQACAKRAIGFAQATIDIPFDTIIREILSQGGMLK
jgi:uncharacterized protein (DUF58 family)